MKYINLTLIILIFLTACGTKNNKNEVIFDSQVSSTKIIAVLTDIQLLESLINTHRDFRDKKKQSLQFQEILNYHKISKQEFDSTMLYLKSNLELYQQILDSVKFNFENMKKVNLPFLQEKNTLDTIKTESPIKSHQIKK